MFVFAFGVRAQSVCEPSPSVSRALLRAPDTADFTIPRDRRLQPIRDLIARYPNDLFVQRRYQDRFRRYPQLYAEFDRAFALYRSKPDDPAFAYLEARLTASFDSPRAQTMFVKQLAANPSFPWPHLGIVELTDRLGARDAGKAELHLRAFLAACPASPEGYALLRTIEDREMIRQGAAKFRALLESRPIASTLGYWPALWTQELRAAPGHEDAVRSRILQDVAKLQKVPPVLSQEWYLLFRSAADLTKDAALSSWLDRTVIGRFPHSSFAATIERARWAKENPRPGRGAPAEAFTQFAARERAWNDELAGRFPGDYNALLDRWLSVEPAFAPRPLEQRLAIADAYTALMRRSPDAGSSSPPWRVTLANYYTRWHVRTDQAPGLIQDGLKQAELEAKYKPVPAMYPEAVRGQMGDGLALSYWRAFLVLADLYLDQRKPAQVRDVIQVGLANIEQRPVVSPASAAGQKDAEFRRASWSLRQARLAALEGNPELALSFYRGFTASLGRQVLERPASAMLETQEAIALAKQAYLASGAAESEWLDWASTSTASAPPAASPALEFAAPLPDFRAADQGGVTWSLASLGGKATLIDLWASWCGPCRAEHQYVQQLYERIRNRTDIQVLTISLDDTSYQAASYLSGQHYTFPVIVSQDVAQRLFPVLGLPQHWIVDALGRRSSPYLTHIADTDRVIADLERAAKKP